ncbi:hypothetical protein C8J57DRAFT_1537517 [Mycena rebaudengoi]|nr:hypothetical protein C8J57DRAFT_1537517 [Mycena rebaudengoi]
MPGFTFISENDKFGAPGGPSAATISPAPGPPPPKQYKKIRFGAFTPGEQKHSLNTRSLVSDVRLAQLMISDSQHVLIESMYAIDTSNPTPPIIDSVFSTDAEGQLQASAVMAQHSLDVDARDDLSNRWTSQWSEEKGKEGAKFKRVLYLCSCGYDHTKRNTKYDRQQPQDHLGSRERHNPLPFTGCLAHAEVTLRAHSIVRIRGHFDHNQPCKDALFTRIPPTPVHPVVFAEALSQLRDGASFSDIRKKNRELLQARAYKDFPVDLDASPFWWLIEHKDSRSLYRQYNRMKGITVTDAPQVNVDEWLDPTSDKFNPTLAHAIFHYSARAEKGDRFEGGKGAFL